MIGLAKHIVRGLSGNLISGECAVGVCHQRVDKPGNYLTVEFTIKITVDVPVDAAINRL